MVDSVEEGKLQARLAKSLIHEYTWALQLIPINGPPADQYMTFAMNKTGKNVHQNY